MRIAAGDIDCIEVARAEALDGPDARVIIRVHSQQNATANRANPGPQRQAGFSRVAMTAPAGNNFVADMTGGKPHVLGVANAKIEMTDRVTGCIDDPIVVSGREAPAIVACCHAIENNRNIFVLERGWRGWQRCHLKQYAQ